MKREFSAILVTATVCGGLAAGYRAAAVEGQARPSLIQRDGVIAVSQPGPHEGGGTTTAYPFFADAACDHPWCALQNLHRNPPTYRNHLYGKDTTRHCSGPAPVEGMNAPFSPDPRIAAASLLFRPTSKMSHDGSWRAACRIRFSNEWFQFGHREVARSVTDPGVGSGALFGD